ncbi:MAG: ferrous iron transport protein A [Desulfuromonadales bacterium]|nr:ferrous iron transport protein A [Desulfuromonadales bacterium]
MFKKTDHHFFCTTSPAIYHENEKSYQSVTQITEPAQLFRHSAIQLPLNTILTLKKHDYVFILSGEPVTQSTRPTLHLSDLKQNQKGIIRHCAVEGILKQKLLSMGFIPGAEVFMVRNAPLRDPIEIGIHNCLVTIRRSEAELIKVDIL